MNETKQILSAIANLPAHKMLWLNDGGEGLMPHSIFTDDLHQLREYVERVELTVISDFSVLIKREVGLMTPDPWRTLLLERIDTAVQAKIKEQDAK